MVEFEERSVPVFALSGVITPATVRTICDGVQSLLATRPDPVVVVDVSGVTTPDMAAIDALARLQLVAKRQGRTIRVVHVCAEMRDLLLLAGLRDVVPVADAELPVERDR